MKFDDCCALDQRLRALYQEALVAGRDVDEFCAYEAWYGFGRWPREQSFKRRMLVLAGYERREGPNQLGGSDAYDCCYQAILDALPRCHGAHCCCNPEREEIMEVVDAHSYTEW